MVVQGCVLDAFLDRGSFACVTPEFCATASVFKSFEAFYHKALSD